MTDQLNQAIHNLQELCKFKTFILKQITMSPQQKWGEGHFGFDQTYIVWRGGRVDLDFIFKVTAAL